MISTDYKVQGMSCHGCERSVELAVAKVTGVESVKADAQTGNLRVEFQSGPVATEVIREAVERSGYRFAGLN